MDTTADSYDCDAVSEVLGRVKIKWAIFIRAVLRDGLRQFNDLKRQAHGISEQIPTRTLEVSGWT